MPVVRGRLGAGACVWLTLSVLWGAAPASAAPPAGPVDAWRSDGPGFLVPPPVFGAAATELQLPDVVFGEAWPVGGQQPPAPAPKPDEAKPGEAPAGTSRPGDNEPSDPQQKPPQPTEPIEIPVVSLRSPENIGFKALVRDTIGDFKALPSKDTALWLAIGGGLALAVSPADDTFNENLAGDEWGTFFALGKYLGYGWVQIGGAVATWAIGLKVDEQGKVAHLGLDLLRAQIVTQTITYALKYATQRERPDGSDNHSFPSGHASTTFATATVLTRHHGWKAAVPGYLVASYVALSRLHDNRHHLSDVAFGATVGLISGRTVTRHGRDSYALIPIVGPRGGVGIGITRVAD